MLMPRDSLMYFTCFSALPVSEVSKRGHEFDRIVRFEPGGLVREKRVGTRMRFVETVPGEFFHQVENVDGFFLRNLIFVAAGQEFRALGGHFFLFLFAHGAAQDVGFPEGKAGQAIGDLHDLFLIEDHAVGFLENIFELRKLVG